MATQAPRSRRANHLPLHVPAPVPQQVDSLPARDEARIRRAYQNRRFNDRGAVARLFAESGLSVAGWARVVGWRCGGMLCALMMLAAPAQADHGGPACMTREELVAALTGRYGETVTQRGISTAVAILEIWTSPAGTWSAVTMDPTGWSCVVAAGRDWGPVTRPVAERAT